MTGVSWSEALLAETAREVTAAKGGDREAFGRVYRAWRAWVLRFAYARIGDLDHAEDITQEAFLRAYQRLDRLRDPTRFPGYIAAIARNLAETLRQRLERQEAGEEAEEVETPESVFLRRDTARKVARVLGQLPRPFRDAAIGYYLEGQATEALARALGCPPATVRSRLIRARARLRRALVEEELTI